jgi:hypothetical protein
MCRELGSVARSPAWRREVHTVDYGDIGLKGVERLTGQTPGRSGTGRPFDECVVPVILVAPGEHERS